MRPVSNWEIAVLITHMSVPVSDTIDYSEYGSSITGRDCRVSEWSQWEGCKVDGDRKCGTGTQKRVRTVCIYTV